MLFPPPYAPFKCAAPALSVCQVGLSACFTVCRVCYQQPFLLFQPPLILFHLLLLYHQLLLHKQAMLVYTLQHVYGPVLRTHKYTNVRQTTSMHTHNAGGKRKTGKTTHEDKNGQETCEKLKRDDGWTHTKKNNR